MTTKTVALITAAVVLAGYPMHRPKRTTKDTRPSKSASHRIGKRGRMWTDGVIRRIALRRSGCAWPEPVSRRTSAPDFRGHPSQYILAGDLRLAIKIDRSSMM